MGLIPLLARPWLLAIKNKWIPGRCKKAPFGREVIILLVSLVTIAFLYAGTLGFLRETSRVVRESALSHQAVLAPFLAVFFAAVFLASAIRCLGSLFLSRDVEFLLAAPVSRMSFFAGKFFDAVVHSIWTYIVFGLPVVCAFDTYLAKSGLLMLWSSAILLPCFLTATGLAMAIVVLFASLVPANRTRDVLLAGGCVFGIVLLLKTASYNLNQHEQMRALIQEIRSIAGYFVHLGPAKWASHALVQAAGGTFPQPSEMLLLLGSAVISVGLACLMISLLHYYAYSKALSPNARQRFESRKAQRRLLFLTPMMTQRFRAFFVKELRLFARDMTQTLQLILLLSICIVYIYNFRFLARFDEIPEKLQGFWHALLLLGNIGMGSLLMSAVCTRFVFPSISLEGSSWWMLQCAPLSLRDIMHTKLMVWFCPIGCISSVVLTTGALALDVDPVLVIITMLMSWIVSYGLIACSIGIGAFFAEFDWDYSSQVSANLASVINMFACMVLSAFNLIPVFLLVVSRALHESIPNMSVVQWFTSIGLSLFLLAFMNLLIGHWIIGIGADALQRRYS